MARAISTTLQLVDQMTTPILHITNAVETLAQQFDKVESAATIGTTPLGTVRSLVEESRRGAQQLAQQLSLGATATQRMEQGQRGFTASLLQGNTAMGGLLGKMGAMVAAYVSLQSGKKVLELSDTMAQITAGLNMMNDGLRTTPELLNSIYAAAERSGGSYTTMADTVAKLGQRAGAAFGSTENVVLFTENLNKLFSIARTGRQEIASASLQLTQALGSGVLRGEELGAIFEAAPSVLQPIADYLGVQVGKIKEMASNGEITADVVVNAMLLATDKINAAFAGIPRTFSRIMSTLGSRAVKAFEQVLSRIGGVLGSSRLDALLDRASSVFSALARGADMAITAVLRALHALWEPVRAVYHFFVDNWAQIAPVLSFLAVAIASVVAIMTTYNTAMAIAAAIQWLFFTPIGLTVLAFLALITAVYLVVGAINALTGASISATGVVLGAFASAGALLWNNFLMLLELILGKINYLVNPIVAFANFLANVFTSPISSILHLFGDMADTVLSLLQSIASAIDLVFGSSLAVAVQGWRDGLSGKIEAGVTKYAPDEHYKEIAKRLDLSVRGLGLDRLEVGGAWDKSYRAGETLDRLLEKLNPEKIFGGGGAFVGEAGERAQDNSARLSGIAGGVSDIAANTGSLAEFSEESVKLWRELAERESIDRFTTAEIRVEFGDIHQSVSSNMDLDGIVNYLGEKVEERLLEVSEGVHA